MLKFFKKKNKKRPQFNMKKTKTEKKIGILIIPPEITNHDCNVQWQWIWEKASKNHASM